MKKDNVKSLFQDLDDWYKLYPQCEEEKTINKINTEQNTLFNLEEE